LRQKYIKDIFEFKHWRPCLVDYIQAYTSRSKIIRLWESS
jgi:hypothetical protein